MDILSIFLYILIASALIQLGYYLFIFRRLAFYKDDLVAQSPLQAVSIIICARNEAENLTKNLSHFLEQDHPSFEVVVINDCSYDESGDILKTFSKKYKHLKIVEIPDHDRYKRGKKFALTLGIKAAKNEFLVFSDADCVPSSPSWLSDMQRSFTNEKEIVLGFSPYKRYFGVLNAFIRFETFFTGLQYLSYSLIGRPYMGVGRNMAYKKELFFRNKGFASHLHILSGDDDLFVNENANQVNTTIMIKPSSHMFSEPKRTFSEYMIQKRRHMSTGKHYKASHKRMLSFFAISGILFYLSLFFLLSQQFMLIVVAGVFMARLLVQLTIFRYAMKKLSSIDLWWYVPFLDIIYSLYMLLMAPLSLFKKQTKWK